MNLRFDDCAITGLLSIIPHHERDFMDDMTNFNFSPARSLKLKSVMGYDKHRLVQGPVCVSDLAVAGFEHLFRSGRLCKDEIDALVLVTACPDHFMPHTTAIIHQRLGLKRDILCVDINQGCAGYIVGLIQAFQLLAQPAIRKVAVVTADVLSRKVSPRDRNSYPLIGDAASISIVEKRPTGPIHANFFMNGAGADALVIPAGGFRQPCTPDTAVESEDADGNWRSPDHLRMDGSAVFSFVMAEVPPMIEALCQAADVDKNAIDYFLFHQPNRFMLEKLADGMGVSREKVPANVVEKYGNSSGSTIPSTITLNLASILPQTSIMTCLAGFGVGLTWASILMQLGPMQFCETFEFEEE